MDAFVSTRELAGMLGGPGVRVLDCTVHLHPLPGGGMRAESGLDDFRAGHVPGALFADLIGALSDPGGGLRFTLPSEERFGAAIGRLGVSDDTDVVIYCAGSPHWAARLWWMLKAFGHDRATVLDGGWEAWRSEGRPIETGEAAADPAVFRAVRRPGYFVGRAEVEAALAPEMLYLTNEDKPGTLAGVASILGEAGINIATFSLGRREPGGDALGLIGVDSPVPDAVLARLRAAASIIAVRRLRF